jgi:hypothetical protein
MKKVLSRVSLAVVASSLLLFTSGGHTAFALPQSGSDVFYYDANWNYLGERYQDCGGGITWDGTREGAVYSHVDTWSCDAGQTPGINGCCYTDQQGNCIQPPGSVNCGF